MSRRRTGKDPVTVEMMLHCLLRWLVAFCHYIDRCMDEVLASTELANKFPETEQELNESAQGFATLSSHGAIKGCVA